MLITIALFLNLKLYASDWVILNNRPNLSLAIEVAESKKDAADEKPVIKNDDFKPREEQKRAELPPDPTPQPMHLIRDRDRQSPADSVDKMGQTMQSIQRWHNPVMK